ncbi:hypothetical protein F5X68DRAFT_187663 [Plectosphaerella plurivora]|uniref:Uncharacterized protein n=1 Tax=Plectosphaerella plurivora TaxID=936078 RepID=A0A9P8VJJ7_9PEZI|nr:hypothetical protein F5X68DRAFT_187663 [Plectosphaerella plurivora]
MAYPESDTTSSPPYGPRSLAGSSQNRSTRELITRNGSPPRAPPPTPLLTNISRFPVCHDSIGLARAHVTPSPRGFYRLDSRAGPSSPWPFKNATPRQSMGAYTVSPMSSRAPSMMARSVSDMSEADITTARPVASLGPLDPAAEAHRTVTMDSSRIADRPPTPMPFATSQAPAINRGSSQMSRGTTRLSQIPRIPTPDLANARVEFFTRPVAANSAVLAQGPVAGLAQWKDPGFDHPLALCVSGVVFVVFACGFAVTITSIANNTARGGQPGSLVVGWAFFNAILIVATGVWIYAVARRHNKLGKAHREAVAARRARQAGEGGALESQIELADMSQHQQQQEEAPAVGSDSDDGERVVRVLPRNGGRHFVRPGTPEPRAPPPTPERGVHAAAHQGGFLGYGVDEGIALSADGVPAAAPAAAAPAEGAAACPAAGEKEKLSSL